MGNICRSPLAEGIFAACVQEHSLNDYFVIDSAGTTDYHVGDLPDQRARKVALQHGVKLTHRARQFVAHDFELFDYILVMDHLNYDAIFSLAGSTEQQSKIFLFRTFDTASPDYYEVPDPYYGGDSDFQEVGEIVKRASDGFIQFLIHSGRLVENKKKHLACL